MDRKERFCKAFEYLRSIGMAHTQKDIAIALESTPSNVSRALKGDPRVLTDQFLIRFSRAYIGIFDLKWLVTGEGEMLLSDTKEEKEEVVSIDMVERFDILLQLVDSHKETIEALKAQLSDKQIIIDSQKREIELLNMRIRGMELEMQMKGVGSYPFGVGAALKSSAPDKI